MKIAAYYRPPKQVSDIDNKLFKEEINGLGIKRKKIILIIGGDFSIHPRMSVLWLGHLGWYSLVYNRFYFCFK
jgi:hypothetical protein